MTNYKYYYPAVLQKEESGYSVWIPDIDGCNSCGDTIAEAIEMVREALGLCIEVMLEKGEEIPKPSLPEDIKLEENQFVAIAEFDLIEYQKKYCSKAVKKTLSIPMYLNELAEKEHINFSSVLREALEERLNVR
jgi:predicted RNase H-like HicB family nuclease